MAEIVALHRRDVLARLTTAAVVPMLPLSRTGDEPLDLALSPNLFTRLGVNALINGQGPFLLIVDTGAGRTTLSRSTADILGLPPGPPLLVHGVTGVEQAPGVGVDRLTMHNVSFRDLHCPVFPDSRIAAHGLLGLDVIGAYRLAFDISRGAASLTRPGFNVVTNSTTMNTGSRIRRDGVRSVRSRYGQLVMTEVVIDGQPVSAFVDSGSQYSIANLRLRDAILRQDAGYRPTRAIRLHGVTDHPITAEMAHVGRIRLGAETLSNIPLLFADLHCFQTLELADRPAMLVGADLLACFRTVSLDFPNNVVAFRGRRPGRTPLDLATSRDA